ncbi:MAG: VOC family protein [Rhodospirillales bacterium]
MIDRLDHLVLTVADIGRTLDFYVRVFGMTEEVFAAGRRALRFGRQINLHPADGEPILPRAARPAPGTADICLIAACPLAEVETHLRKEGFPIEEGPTPAPAPPARSARSTSVTPTATSSKSRVRFLIPDSSAHWWTTSGCTRPPADHPAPQWAGARRPRVAL